MCNFVDVCGKNQYQFSQIVQETFEKLFEDYDQDELEFEFLMEDLFLSPLAFTKNYITHAGDSDMIEKIFLFCRSRLQQIFEIFQYDESLIVEEVDKEEIYENFLDTLTELYKKSQNKQEIITFIQATSKQDESACLQQYILGSLITIMEYSDEYTCDALMLWRPVQMVKTLLEENPEYPYLIQAVYCMYCTYLRKTKNKQIAANKFLSSHAIKIFTEFEEAEDKFDLQRPFDNVCIFMVEAGVITQQSAEYWTQLMPYLKMMDDDITEMVNVLKILTSPTPEMLQVIDQIVEAVVLIFFSRHHKRIVEKGGEIVENVRNLLYTEQFTEQIRGIVEAADQVHKDNFWDFVK